MLRLYATLALFAALALSGYFFAARTSFSEAQTIVVGVRDFKELSDRFTALAEDKGGEYAFEVLRRAALPPQTDIHLLGHVVGDELYIQQGVGGIAVCTQDFRNACSHSIVIGALNEHGGEEALGLIRDACKKAPGGNGAYTMCYHGLGHGVFAFFGYEIPETVEFCKKTGTEAHAEREYIECIGGAVMELMGGGGHDRDAWLASRERFLPQSKPLAPCMEETIPTEAKAICLVYLTPRLWELAGIDLGRPDPTLFPKAFSFCEQIPQKEQALRYACFGGFGKEFVPLAGGRDIRDVGAFSDADFARALGWCELAVSEDGEIACINEGVSSLFWGGENDPDASFRFCSLISEGNTRNECFERLAYEVRSYITEPALRVALCGRIPEQYKGICGD